MKKSNINQFIIAIKFGKKNKYSLTSYNYEDAILAKNRLIDVGVNPTRIKIIPYESILL